MHCLLIWLVHFKRWSCRYWESAAQKPDRHSTDILLITEKILQGNSGNTENHKTLSPWKPIYDCNVWASLSPQRHMRPLTLPFDSTFLFLIHPAEKAALCLTVAKSRASRHQGVQPWHWPHPNGQGIGLLKLNLQQVKLHLSKCCKRKTKHEKVKSEIESLAKSASQTVTYFSSS